MKTRLVTIGNSRGVRIPKSVIEQCGFENEVEMTVRKNALILVPAEHPRKGWAEQFRRATRTDDDDPIDDFQNDWDKTEWEWK